MWDNQEVITLLTLLAQGKSIKEAIRNLPGRTLPAARSRLYKMFLINEVVPGLPPGIFEAAKRHFDAQKKTGKWTEQELSVIEQGVIDGETARQLIGRLPGRTYDAISMKMSQFRESRVTADCGCQPINQKKRTCLKCSCKFVSMWNGERICERCKWSDEWRGSGDVYSYGGSVRRHSVPAKVGASE